MSTVLWFPTGLKTVRPLKASLRRNSILVYGTTTPLAGRVVESLSRLRNFGKETEDVDWRPHHEEPDEDLNKVVVCQLYAGQPLQPHHDPPEGDQAEAEEDAADDGRTAPTDGAGEARDEEHGEEVRAAYVRPLLTGRPDGNEVVWIVGISCVAHTAGGGFWVRMVGVVIIVALGTPLNGAWAMRLVVGLIAVVDAAAPCFGRRLNVSRDTAVRHHDGTVASRALSPFSHTAGISGDVLRTVRAVKLEGHGMMLVWPCANARQR